MFGVVTVPVQSFVSSVKRIGDRTVPCGTPVEINRETKYSLVTNCLRTIDKKVDNPENQSWVNDEFQTFACHEVWLYGTEGRRKVEEDNSDK